MNDLIKLLRFCYEETKELIKERREQKERERKEKELKEISIQMEEDMDQQELEKKLDHIYLQLVKACAPRSNESNRTNIKLTMI